MKRAFLLAIVALLTVASLGQVSVAQEEGAGPSASFGLDVTTHYFFRGIMQEDQGFIAMPWGEFGLPIFESDGPIQSLSWTTGVWASLHDENTGAGGASFDPNLGQLVPDNGFDDTFYEFDFYTGVSVGFADAFSFDTVYTSYMSPNNAFKTIQEIGFGLSVDDAALLGTDLGLNPYFMLVFETADKGGSEDQYAELGVEPSLTLVESEDAPISVSFPVTVGFSLSDYYVEANGDEDEFGYATVGANVSMPLAMVPEHMGSWEAHAGVDLYFLGNATEAANNGDDFEVVGTFGVSVSY